MVARSGPARLSVGLNLRLAPARARPELGTEMSDTARDLRVRQWRLESPVFPPHSLSLGISNIAPFLAGSLGGGDGGGRGDGGDGGGGGGGGRAEL